jgi:hypothetical protein
MRDVQEKGFSRLPEEKRARMKKLSDAFEDLFGSGDKGAGFVILNKTEGIATQGASAASARQVVMAATVAPVGILAGVAVPSFVKARKTAKRASCINNLRQIDSAKEQWALANSKADGDQPDSAGVAEYLRSGRLPVCPAGGTYTLNPIGRDPECSVHGTWR